MRALMIAAALTGLLLVAAGASGGHDVPLEATSRWQTAFMYGYIHALGALLAATLPFRGWLHLAGGWAFILSVPLFSGVQIARIMLGGIPMTPTVFDNLTFLVPVGGVFFIVGWLMIGLAAAMAPRRDEPEEEDAA